MLNFGHIIWRKLFSSGCHCDDCSVSKRGPNLIDQQVEKLPPVSSFPPSPLRRPTNNRLLLDSFFLFSRFDAFMNLTLCLLRFAVSPITADCLVFFSPPQSSIQSADRPASRKTATEFTIFINSASLSDNRLLLGSFFPSRLDAISGLVFSLFRFRYPPITAFCSVSFFHSRDLTPSPVSLSAFSTPPIYL